MTTKDKVIALMMFLLVLGDEFRPIATTVSAVVIVLLNLRTIVTTVPRLRIVVKPLPGEEPVTETAAPVEQTLPPGIPEVVDGFELFMHEGKVKFVYRDEVTGRLKRYTYKRYLQNQVRETEGAGKYRRLLQEYEDAISNHVQIEQ